MDSKVEKLVWNMALEVYGDSLSLIVSEALVGYKRSPGFDELARLYQGTAGYQALSILTEALKRRWPNYRLAHSAEYVELRFRLRSHLREYLLRRLVLDGAGAPVLMDAHFAGDLGV